jgi:hypothetical protein
MGVEVKDGNSAPFQESQCQVIFSVLGVPQPSDWEGLESLPEYDKIRGWRSGYPTKSVLREVRGLAFAGWHFAAVERLRVRRRSVR